MIKFGFLILILVVISLAIVLITLFAVNDHEDDTVWLDSFMDQCMPTPKNKALAERELDMLRYRISEERFIELLNKFNTTFE